MGVPELLDKRYVNARKPLTQTDTLRLKSLAGKEAYEAVVTYMLAHNCKLEQELSLIHIYIDDFTTDDDYVGIYLSNPALRKFINKFERKLNMKNKYLAYEQKEYSFQMCIRDRN